MPLLSGSEKPAAVRDLRLQMHCVDTKVGFRSGTFANLNQIVGYLAVALWSILKSYEYALEEMLSGLELCGQAFAGLQAYRVFMLWGYAI